MDDHRFAWILWYIRKIRNNKVFNNLNIDPRKTLKFAKTESTIWVRHLNIQRATHQVEVTNIQSIQGDGVLQIVLGKKMIYFQDKFGIVL